MHNINDVLWWMAGADANILRESSRKARMLHTTLGIIAVVVFLFVSMTWGKVGFVYFKWPGCLIGPLVASAYIIGLDRLIAMGDRVLKQPYVHLSN